MTTIFLFFFFFFSFPCDSNGSTSNNPFKQVGEKPEERHKDNSSGGFMSALRRGHGH